MRFCTSTYAAGRWRKAERKAEREREVEREERRKEKGGNRVAFMCVPEVAKLYLRAGQRLLEFAKS